MCAPQCWHKRCHFSICTPYKARLWCCARVLLIWFQMKSLLSYFVGPCRGMQIFPRFSVGWASCGQFHCQPQNRSLTDTLCFTPTAPPMRFCLQLSLQLFVRRRWDCVVVISRQFKPSAEEGWQSERGAVWASGWKWIIPTCLSGSPLPPRISLFLNAECTWRGLRSQCLSVCNLAPSLPRVRCRLWNRIQLQRRSTLSEALLINARCNPTDSICLWNVIIIVCPPFPCMLLPYLDKERRWKGQAACLWCFLFCFFF